MGQASTPAGNIRILPSAATGIGEVFSTTRLVAAGVGYASGLGSAYDARVGGEPLRDAHAVVEARAKWYAEVERRPDMQAVLALDEWAALVIVRPKDTADVVRRAKDVGEVVVR